MMKSKEDIYEAVVAAVRHEEPCRSKGKDITMSTNLKYEFGWDSLDFGLAITRCEDELKFAGAEFDMYEFADAANKVETVGDIVDAMHGFQKQ